MNRQNFLTACNFKLIPWVKIIITTTTIIIVSLKELYTEA
jgi:hypothetical protein